MVVLRFIWLIVSFLVVELCVFMPLYLAGILVFPLAYRYAGKVYRESNINTGYWVLTFKNPILNEWLGNHEDGLLPSWWVQERDGSAYGWFLRNPICNMRFWPVVSTLPSKRTSWYGNLIGIPSDNRKGWFLAWQGPYTGFWWQGKARGCWFGWAVNPADFLGTNDYRSHGLGLKSQIWRVK